MAEHAVIVERLLAQIAADPADAAAQLVLADHLMSFGDARGELIALDHRDRTAPGGLRDVTALERLLLLAAEYTFPCARDVPHAPLPFEGGGGHPVQYRLAHEGHDYYVHYRRGALSMEIDDGAIPTGVEYPDGFPEQVHDKLLGLNEWTDEETGQILAVLGDAIRAGTPLCELQFHAMTDALPTYAAGPRRCYRLPAAFTAPRGIVPNRYGLAARDYDRWHVLWVRLRMLERWATR